MNLQRGTAALHCCLILYEISKKIECKKIQMNDLLVGCFKRLYIYLIQNDSLFPYALSIKQKFMYGARVFYEFRTTGQKY